MSNTTSSSISGLSGTLLFITFFVLKVTGYIDWSWWWVTAPLWGPLALGASIGLGVLAYYNYKKRAKG